MKSIALFLERQAGVIVLAVAVLFALPSIGYPFGRDQALYSYVAHGWLDHGLLPYRDMFDQKPPGIYIVYGIANRIFGDHQYAIHVGELLAVLAGGWVLAGIVAERRRVSIREAGVQALLLVGFYYGTFDYWDSGQVEIWEGLALLAAQWSVVTQRNAFRGTILAALWCGCAFLLKFPSLLAVPVFGLQLWVRHCRIPGKDGIAATCRISAIFATAFGTLPIICLTYFSARGGLNEMYDVLIGYNSHYLATKQVDLPAAIRACRFFWMDHERYVVIAAGGLWLLGAIVSFRRLGRSGLFQPVVSLSLVLLTFLSVCMQGKFYPYHWGVVIPMLALGAAQGLRQLPERAQSAIPLAICAVLYLIPVPWVSNKAENMQTRTNAFWNYVSGDIDRRTYLLPFIGKYGYAYEKQDFIGTYIRDRSRSGDLLHIRGFEPAIYDVAGLRSPSRFFADFPLVDPQISYRRDEWKALHEKILWETLPRWFITRKSIIQTDYPLLINAGYHEVLTVDRFVLFEHGDE